MTENHLFFMHICTSLMDTFKDILYTPSSFWSKMRLEKRELVLSFSKKNIPLDTIFFIPELPIVFNNNTPDPPYMLPSAVHPHTVDVYPAGIPFEWRFQFAASSKEPSFILKDIAKLSAFLFSHRTLKPFLLKTHFTSENLWQKLLQEKAILTSEACHGNDSSLETVVFFKICYHALYHSSVLLRQEKQTKQYSVHTHIQKKEKL